MLGFLTQGISPGKLALTLALGMTLSCFPVFGATTILCALVAIVFRLNLPVIEVGNYLALPLQMILLVPFLRLGERIFHSPRVPLSPPTLLTMLHNSPDSTMHLLMADQGHAIVAWAIVAPIMAIGFTLILLPLLRRLLRRLSELGSVADLSQTMPRTIQGN